MRDEGDHAFGALVTSWLLHKYEGWDFRDSDVCCFAVIFWRWRRDLGNLQLQISKQIDAFHVHQLNNFRHSTGGGFRFVHAKSLASLVYS